MRCRRPLGGSPTPPPVCARTVGLPRASIHGFCRGYLDPHRIWVKAVSCAGCGSRRNPSEAGRSPACLLPAADPEPKGRMPCQALLRWAGDSARGARLLLGIAQLRWGSHPLSHSRARISRAGHGAAPKCPKGACWVGRTQIDSAVPRRVASLLSAGIRELGTALRKACMPSGWPPTRKAGPWPAGAAALQLLLAGENPKRY